MDCLFSSILVLASGAVHGAMAGYTGFTVGMVNGHSVMIPMCRHRAEIHLYRTKEVVHGFAPDGQF